MDIIKNQNEFTKLLSLPTYQHLSKDGTLGKLSNLAN
jgi:hypothetical protein